MVTSMQLACMARTKQEQLSIQAEASAVALSTSAAFRVSLKSGQPGSRMHSLKTLQMRSASPMELMIHQTGERKTQISRLHGP